MIIRIELAEITEADTIRQLLCETWMDTYGPYLSERTIQEVTSTWHCVELLKSQIANPAIFFGVAKDEANAIIGLVTVRNMEDDGITIYRLYVRPDRQRMGIGERLLVEAIAAFPNHKKIRLEVEEQNQKGLAFWRKQGFREAGRKHQLIAQETIAVIEMEKQ